MKPIHFLPVSVLMALAFASAEDESANGQGKVPLVHLYLDGQWNTDSDVFIYPDDTYVYHTYSDKDRKTVRKLVGKSKGLFLEVIGLVDKYKMWTLTTDSLKQDLRAAQKGKGVLGVADASHQYLTITFGDQMLKADFYSPETFSSHYPEAKQLASFDFVTSFIISKTEKREHKGGTDQSATKSADKVPVKNQPSSPTSKDAPR